MFTGLVTDMGAVERLVPRQGGARLTLRPRALDVDALVLGESVACSGVCLTVVERGGGLVSFDAVPETLEPAPEARSLTADPACSATPITRSLSPVAAPLALSTWRWATLPGLTCSPRALTSSLRL